MPAKKIDGGKAPAKKATKKATKKVKKATKKTAKKAEAKEIEKVMTPKAATEETPKAAEPKTKRAVGKKPIKGDQKTYNEPVQPLMNIGLVGHVDHGKTTLTERLSGKWTDTHSEEIKRGITIRLGYADTVFRKCPQCDGDKGYTTKSVCPDHQCPTEPLLKISFVDAPGHESLMATMLSGATIMDGALLLIAANELCPQPQTKEHLMALEISGIDKIVVVQNKVDLVSKERAIRNYQQIKEFLKGTKFEDAPVVPISAQRGVNIDILIKTMLETFTVPERDRSKDPLMVVARSFDINKPGTKPGKLKGGVLGGALKQGVLTVGDRIEIRPGRIVEEANKIKAKPLFAKIVSIVTGGQAVQEVVPGGSIALMTTLDHGVVRADSLTGSVVGHAGKLPPIWDSLILETKLLERVVGAHEDLKVNPLMMNEILMLNVNSAATVGIVTELSKNKVSCRLKKPICASVGARVTISRRVGTRFRLIGYGIVTEPKK